MINDKNTTEEFVELSNMELLDTNGGSFDLAAPIKAIYKIGQDVGRALAKWF